MRNIKMEGFKRLSKAQIEANLPVVITAIDKNPNPWRQAPLYIVGKPGETIILSDLHPIMQAKLRNIELQARSAMPKQPEETIVVSEKGEVSIEVK